MSECCSSGIGDSPSLTFRVCFAPDAVPVSLKGVVMCTHETLTLLQELPCDPRVRTSPKASRALAPSPPSFSNMEHAGVNQSQHRFLGVCTVPLIQFYRQDRRVCLTRGCTYIFDNAAVRSRIEETPGVSLESSNPSYWQSVLLQFESTSDVDTFIEMLLQGFAEEIFIPPTMPDNITDVMRAHSCSRHRSDGSRSGKEEVGKEEDMEEDFFKRDRNRKRRVFQEPLPPLPSPPPSYDDHNRNHTTSTTTTMTAKKTGKHPLHGHEKDEEEWVVPISYKDMQSSHRKARNAKEFVEIKKISREKNRDSPSHSPHSWRKSMSSSSVVVDVKTVTTPGNSSIRHISKSHHHYPFFDGGEKGKGEKREERSGRNLSHSSQFSSSPSRRKAKSGSGKEDNVPPHCCSADARAPVARPRYGSHSHSRSRPPHDNKENLASPSHHHHHPPPPRPSSPSASSRAATPPASSSKRKNRDVTPRHLLSESRRDPPSLEDDLSGEVENLCIHFMRFEHHRQHMLLYLHREVVRRTFQAAVLTLEESRLLKSLEKSKALTRKIARSASRQNSQQRREETQRKKSEEKIEQKLRELKFLSRKVRKEGEKIKEERKTLEMEKEKQKELHLQQQARAPSPSMAQCHLKKVPESVPSSPVSSAFSYEMPNERRSAMNAPLSAGTMGADSPLPPMKVIKFHRTIIGKDWGTSFFPHFEEDVRHSALIDIALATKLNRALIEIQRVEPVERRGSSTSTLARCVSAKRSRPVEGRHWREGDDSEEVVKNSSRRSPKGTRDFDQSFPFLHRKSTPSRHALTRQTQAQHKRESRAKFSSSAATSDYDEVVGDEDVDGTTEGKFKEGRDSGLLITAKIRFFPSAVLSSDILRHRLRLCGFPILGHMYASQALFRYAQDYARKNEGKREDRSKDGGETRRGGQEKKFPSPKSRRISPKRCESAERFTSPSQSYPSARHHHSHPQSYMNRGASIMVSTRIATAGLSGRSEGSTSQYRSKEGRLGVRRLSPGGPGGGRSASRHHHYSNNPSPNGMRRPSSRSPSPSSPSAEKYKGEKVISPHTRKLHGEEVEEVKGEGYKERYSLSSSSHKNNLGVGTCSSSFSFLPYPQPQISAQQPLSSGVSGAYGLNPVASDAKREDRQRNEDTSHTPYRSAGDGTGGVKINTSPLWSYGPVTTAGAAAHGREQQASLEVLCSTETVDRAVMDVAEARQRRMIMNAHRHRFAFLELEDLERSDRRRLVLEEEPMQRYYIQVQVAPLKYFPEAMRSIIQAEELHRDQICRAQAQARQWLEKQRDPFLAKGVAMAKEALRKEEAAIRLQLESEALSRLLDIITYDQRQRSWWGKRSSYDGNKAAGMLCSMRGELVEVEREERLGIVKYEARLRMLMGQALYEKEEELYAQRLRTAAALEITELSFPSRGMEIPMDEQQRRPSSQLRVSDALSRESNSLPGGDQSSLSHRRRRFQSQKHLKHFHYMTFSPEDMDFKPNAESATEGILGCTINRNLEVVEISRPLSKRDGEEGDEFQTGDMILDASGQALHSLSHFREVLSHRIMLIQEEAKMEFPGLPEEEWTTNPAMQKYIEVLCDHHNFMIQVLRGCDIVQLIVKS